MHVGIVGAGLAGLTAAIHLAKAGLDVSLFEKTTYPKHKVCGEYISNEILPYWNSLDIEPQKWGSVPISELQLSTQKGKIIESSLPLGGFGISRYTLDFELWKKAKALGVRTYIAEVTNILREISGGYTIKTKDEMKYAVDFVIAGYGKRSLLDTTLQRNFSNNSSPWLGVKAHYKGDIPNHLVQLHNFEGGYCGISKIEEGKVNVCYLVHYESFKAYKNIQQFQERVLHKNKYLKSFFTNSEMLFEKPLAIAQINFSQKKIVERKIVMCGDAAGLIHPLCGNGMAMAIGGAKIISEILLNHKKGSVKSFDDVARDYTFHWNKSFKNRLQTGRYLQRILLYPKMQNAAYGISKVMPFAVPGIIAKTHGQPLSKAQL